MTRYAAQLFGQFRTLEDILRMNQQDDVQCFGVGKEPINGENLRVAPMRLQPKCGRKRHHAVLLRRWPDGWIFQIAEKHLYLSLPSPRVVLLGFVRSIVMIPEFATARAVF